MLHAGEMTQRHGDLKSGLFSSPLTSSLSRLLLGDSLASASGHSLRAVAASAFLQHPTAFGKAASLLLSLCLFTVRQNTPTDGHRQVRWHAPMQNMKANTATQPSTLRMRVAVINAQTTLAKANRTRET